LKAGACALLIAAGVTFAPVSRQQTAPRYEAVVNWPKPLPERWVLGGLGGHCVDAKDHVLILNRQDVQDGDLNAGQLAPPLIEFDPDGNMVHAWGDPKVLDPRLHSCHFDKDGNVWVASAPSGMVQKYTRDGKRLLLQIGTKGKLDSSDGTAKGKPLNSPAAAFFMPSSIRRPRQRRGLRGRRRRRGHESPRRRVRPGGQVPAPVGHGGHAERPLHDDRERRHRLRLQPAGFGRPGLRQDGQPAEDYPRSLDPGDAPGDGVAREIGGSAVAVDFSPDKAQRLLFVLNQNNSQIEIIERATGKKLGSFGRPGAFPGEFNQAHGIAVDSKGNVYVSENRGRRIHKFRMVSE
jgi:hypothetical protein